MSVRKLEYFVASVEYGSFSKAAEHLYVSASAVNQQITSLEEEINLQLFDRTSYRPILTESGRSFYASSKLIIKTYYEAIEKARGESKVLRVGPTGPVELQFLSEYISQYQKEHLEVSFELKNGSFRAMRESILNRSLDVAFGLEDDFQDEQIKMTPLKQFDMVVVCSKDHPFASKKSIKGHELALCDMLVFSKEVGEFYYQNMLNSFELDGVKPKIRGVYDSVDELLTAIRIKKGVAVLTPEVVKPYPDLVMVDLVETHHNSSYCVAQHVNASSLSDAFVDFVVKKFKD